MRQKGCVTWRSRSEMHHLWAMEDKPLVGNFPAQRRKRERIQSKMHGASCSAETSCQIYASAGMNERKMDIETALCSQLQGRPLARAHPAEGNEISLH